MELRMVSTASPAVQLALTPRERIHERWCLLLKAVTAEFLNAGVYDQIFEPTNVLAGSRGLLEPLSLVTISDLSAYVMQRFSVMRSTGFCDALQPI